MLSIGYRIDRDLGIVVSTWEGDITTKGLIDHFTPLLSDEDAMAIGRSLGDIRKAHLRFTGGELRKIIESIVRPRLGGGAGGSPFSSVAVFNIASPGSTRSSSRRSATIRSSKSRTPPSSGF